MFDFQETLNNADYYVEQGNHALAAFNYWLIDFAFNDEEFPYSYTSEIGEKGRNGFLKMMKKHKNEILTDPSYLKLRDTIGSGHRYICNFERVVKWFQKRHH